MGVHLLHCAIRPSLCVTVILDIWQFMLSSTSTSFPPYTSLVLVSQVTMWFSALIGTPVDILTGREFNFSRYFLLFSFRSRRHERIESVLMFLSGNSNTHICSESVSIDCFFFIMIMSSRFFVHLVIFGWMLYVVNFILVGCWIFLYSYKYS